MTFLPEEQPFFWMGGVLATDLVELDQDCRDLTKLDDGGFWVVATTFEGRILCAILLGCLIRP